ncbi:hypothetical protein [Streptomyces spongiae]|uniref:Uncharacterized protein n=1 Tax=Streptomyces spongiae TaxID=565072 RepID=A0A5N8XJM5_9ACTN|nr:hypothetical protein [Streptomyces spongiae]MPY59316.1 hypothetical protein [Streptomyces spongiae]
MANRATALLLLGDEDGWRAANEIQKAALATGATGYGPRLSPRERQVVALVAQGMTALETGVLSVESEESAPRG